MSGKAGSGCGGAREGAGRKPDPVALVDNEELETDDPIAFLRALMRDKSVDIKLRQDSAKRLMAFEKSGGKKGETGKKGERAQAAAEASEGRFAPGAPPKLRAVK